MGIKVILTFSGTYQSAHDVYSACELGTYENDVVRVYFNGCQDSAISGRFSLFGVISPNLDTAARKVRACFTETGTLSLSALRNQFGASLIIAGDKQQETIIVDSIHLSGFSRGGVTAFSTARHLDDLKIPMTLIAQNPVPGESIEYSRNSQSEYNKNHDLRSLNHLKNAEIILGANSNNVNRLHNTYFRQMAPLFNEHCDSSIYLVPEDNHLDINNMACNYYYDFQKKHALLKSCGTIDEEMAKCFLVPKIIQQKFHLGVEGRTSLLPRYKNRLADFIKVAKHADCMRSRVKIWQALYAINLAPAYVATETKLYEKIKSDKSYEGIALREFIVEFENINQYILRAYPDDKVANTMIQFRAVIYHSLDVFLASDRSLQEQQMFYNNIGSCLSSFTEVFSNEQHLELTRLLSLFLKENVLFHVDLSRYIDESEKHQTKVTVHKDADTAPFNIAQINNADTLAEVLYRMSDDSRLEAFELCAENLKHIVKDAEQLANIIRFLLPGNIDRVVGTPEIKLLIKGMDELNLVMKKLCTSAQRKQLYMVMQSSIEKMQASPQQLIELQEHLASTVGDPLHHSGTGSRLASLYNLMS